MQPAAESVRFERSRYGSNHGQAWKLQHSPSTRTPPPSPCEYAFWWSISGSYVWWFDQRREIKDLGSISLHRWCFHPLQLGGKVGKSQLWSSPNHLYTSIVFVILCYPPFVSYWFLGADTPFTWFRWSCFPFIQLVVLHLTEERCCR